MVTLYYKIFHIEVIIDDFKKKVLSVGLIACMLAANPIAASAASLGGEGSSDASGYSSASPSDVLSYASEAEATASNAVGVDAGAGGTTDYSGYKSVEAATRQVSNGVYEILDENGKAIATYETMEKEDVPQARTGWTIDWALEPGVQTIGDSRIQSYDGFAFAHSIDFSQTGCSKIGVAAHDEQTIYWSATSSDSFNGVLTVSQNMGMVSLAMKNNSSDAITYSGVYYI